MVLDSLAARVPVFCEKPLCLTTSELDQITTAQGETGLPVWVGFNRRYSQLGMTLKECLRTLPRPLALSYRVNAGSLAADHWLQDPQVGGGRLVGEGCHFFDMMLFLLEVRGESPNPVSVQAIAAPAAGGNGPRDTLVVAIRFDDGSVASLVYAAGGSPALGKELIEVHGGGASFILDDFRSLISIGAEAAASPKRSAIKLKKPDKGIVRQWKEIAKAMRGEDSSAITYPEVRRTMELTFRAEAALRGEP
jgi:polar amino acid transport system substrate-binding protein